ncbi:ATP-binding protein [Bifidobacterium olomucense]|uniref:Histidine kinase n=1 Tax=Bifidobacterium olomucense TaxID=2675324 RepID=A0A7Y0HVI7_9BIFI|nr:ATP-binding protein [Bifidobacterium sp. DSM 109959]NMM97261.1 histidine kinase [Bifidobacterium sp. DSM 109959]
MPVTPMAPAQLPLMRPKQGRWLTGVCKGIALHLGVSVTWVRLAFVLLTMMYGAGIIGYLFLWIFMPSGDPVAAAAAACATVPVGQAPLSRGNAGSIGTAVEGNDGDAAATPESLAEAVKRAPKPALVALSGVLLMGIGLLLVSSGVDTTVILPLLLGMAGIALAWMNLSPHGTQLLSMLGGIALIFCGWALYVSNATFVMAAGWGTSPRRIMLSGFIMLVAVVVAVLPWASAMLQQFSHEKALKEREEERADMTAHLHDGVLQTLALIQLHNQEPDVIFTLARAQERELREWLYQERSTSDRSVSAGLKKIAAEVEDGHGKPIEVVIVGDARPSAQTDALLDATRQALVNAVTHGGEPISLYCEAGATLVEAFVRDHGSGFDIDTIPPDRLGIRESIIGRIKRRGGTVEIVSRPGWGTEVRMHMPIALHAASQSTAQSAASPAAQSAAPQGETS